jgi:hypothetical protein
MPDPYHDRAIRKRLTLSIEKGYISILVLIREKGNSFPAVWRGRVYYQGLKR